jgi:hypothetical protein
METVVANHPLWENDNGGWYSFPPASSHQSHHAHAFNNLFVHSPHSNRTDKKYQMGNTKNDVCQDNPTPRAARKSVLLAELCHSIVYGATAHPAPNLQTIAAPLVIHDWRDEGAIFSRLSRPS